MKKNTLPPQTFIHPKPKIALWLGCSLFLSGCVSLPFVSYEPPKKQTSTENAQYQFKPKTMAYPPSSPLYVSRQSFKKTPDITSEETHQSDINRTFYPVIWQEMQHQFDLSIKYLGKYNDHIDYFSQNPDYLKTVSQRAKPYLHYILSQVQLRDMPYEMALLPIIESGFRPTARSHKEAGGLWQFIPSTGRLYGLEQNWWYDGRQDVILSTQAALDYLQELHRINNNDWLLALASYNAGPGTIRNAIRKYHKKHKQPQKQPSFWDIQPYLPKETQNYVPQLLAVSHVINHPDNFNADLEPIENSPFFATVSLPKQIHLKKAMQLAQVSESTFAQLNAGYLAQITPPDGSYHILLPVDKAKNFQDALASNHDLFDIQWQKHTIKSGESLGVIAQKYRISQKEIKKLNNMKSHRIRAGKTLLIPIPNNTQNTAPVSNTLLAKNTQDSPPNAKPTSAQKVHRVRSGDSLWRIARAYNTDVKSLVRWNNLNAKKPLKKGQRLNIQSNTTTKHRQKMTITLKKGQSLWTVAQQYNVTTQALARWNNISQSKTLQPGMKLTIWQQKSLKNKKSYAQYKIQDGDNLWKIAKKNRISTSQLAKYNNLSIKTYLQPGQVLKIPI